MNTQSDSTSDETDVEEKQSSVTAAHRPKRRRKRIVPQTSAERTRKYRRKKNCK